MHFCASSVDLPTFHSNGTEFVSCSFMTGPATWAPVAGLKCDQSATVPIRPVDEFDRSKRFFAGNPRSSLIVNFVRLPPRIVSKLERRSISSSAHGGIDSSKEIQISPA